MSIFDEGTPKQEENEVASPEATQESKSENPSSEDPYGVLLKSITREDGSQMYSSVEDALKGLAHTKQHVATVETEKKQLSEEFERMKAEYEKAKAAAEAIDRLAPKQEQPESRPASNAIDEGTLKNMFQSFLQETETKKTRAQNEEQVSKALTEKFGSKAKEQFTKTAEELGIPASELRELAGKSPTAVLKLFGTASKPDATPNTSSINTSGLRPQEQQQAPRKSVLVGASTEELTSALKRNKQKIYEKYGIQS